MPNGNMSKLSIVPLVIWFLRPPPPRFRLELIKTETNHVINHALINKTSQAEIGRCVVFLAEI